MNKPELIKASILTKQLRISHCCIPNCRSIYVNNKPNNKHFFRCTPGRRDEWLRALAKINLVISNYDRVCELHFAKECFKSNMRNALHLNAVPTIFNKSDDNKKEETKKGDGMNGKVNSIEIQRNLVNSSEKSGNVVNSMEINQNKVNSMGINGNKVNAATNTEINLREIPLIKVNGKIKIDDVVGKRREEPILAKAIQKPRKSFDALSKKTQYRMNRTKVLQSKLKISKRYNVYNFLRSLCLDDEGIHILETQLEDSKQKRPLNDTKLKALALAIYKRSPTRYKQMKQFLLLPKNVHLQRAYRTFAMQPGISPVLFNKLELKVRDMQRLDKYCVLLIDTITLLPQLQYDEVLDECVGMQNDGLFSVKNMAGRRVLVFMLRGIRSGWKQPICYYITNDFYVTSLKSVVKDLILSIEVLGLSVIATVCDQCLISTYLINALQADCVQDKGYPYFLVNDKEVVTMCDVTHLMKSTRNALNKYDIVFDADDKCAKFEFCLAAWKHDVRRVCPTLYRLDKQFFRVPAVKRVVRTDYSVKVLSRSVAAAIESAISPTTTGGLPAHAIHTAEFVANCDLLFDSFNGSEQFPRVGKALRCALTSYSPHMEFWMEMEPFISSWRFKSARRPRVMQRLHIATGWLHNIQAIKQIWAKLSRIGFTHLLPRHLNLDPLDNYLAHMQRCARTELNPNHMEFRAAFTCGIFNAGLSVHSPRANCEIDGGSFLVDLCELLDSPASVIEETTSSTNVNALPASDIAICSENVRLENISDLASLLIADLHATIECECCLSFLLYESIDSIHTYTPRVQRMQRPTNDFLTYMNNVYTNTATILDSYAHYKRLGEQIYARLEQCVPFGEWFMCDVHVGDMHRVILKKCVAFTIRKWCALKSHEMKVNEIVL